MTDTFTIALAGNPNVGKSTVFNALTGMRQHTGNWPGKTVACAKGTYTYMDSVYTLVDLPGTYSLYAHSREEEIARDFILGGEAQTTIVVCDATCLERNLNLVLQIIRLTTRVVVCVNLCDEAKKKGIVINLPLLSDLLGVPVIGTSATKKKGLKDLIEATASMISFGSMVPCCEISDNHLPEDDAVNIILQAEELTKKVVTIKKKDYHNKDAFLDRLFTGPLTGFPIMFLLLLGVFWLTMAGANYPSDWLITGFFFIEDKLYAAAHLINMPQWMQGVLISGIYHVLAWVVSVMLPPMAIFFPLFTLLEDFGYLPRVAFNLDSPFKRCKACGKQSLTMCMGLGCNAVGVMGCRIIDSERERLIAILTNSLIPCNGRFPTLLTLITLFFIGNSSGVFGSLVSAVLLTGVLILGVLMTLAVSRLLSATLLKGIPSSFTLELPPYRKPQIGKVILRSIFDRTLFVLGRAASVAAPAGLVIWVMANLKIGNQSILFYCSNFLDPFARLMGMDGVILLAFILGFPANEIVIPLMLMAYMQSGQLIDISNTSELKNILLSNGWTSLTAISCIIFSLFHWPCSTTCLTIKKETGSIKWTLIAILIPTLLGVLLCMGFTGIARMIGIF